MDLPRGKLRVSLRTLMLLVAVAAGLSALFAWWTRKEYRYGSLADAKASCDRKHTHSGRVPIATWGDTIGPYRQSQIAVHFNAVGRGHVTFTLDRKRHQVQFTCRDEVVVESFENPRGNGLRLVYGKDQASLLSVHERVESQNNEP